MPTPSGLDDETPDLKDLRAFCLAVDLGTITAAARALGETKSSVSRRLVRLERQSGASLLRRSPTRVTPTEEGLAYRARLQRPLALLDEAHAGLRHARGTPQGRIRIAAPTDYAVAVLAPIVASFMQRYPEVGIDLLDSELYLDFEKDRLDIAFRAALTLENSSLIARKLGDAYGKLFASPAYEERHGLPTTPAELRLHKILGVFWHGKPLALRRIGRSTESPGPIELWVRAHSFSLVRELSIAGGGIGVLPTEMSAQDIEQARLVPVLSEYCVFKAGLFLVHRGGRHIAAHVRVFREHVLAELGLSAVANDQRRRP